MKDMLNNEATILPQPEEEEIWVDMADMGYPRYQVSSFGRLKGPKGLLHPRTDKNGYLYCCLYRIENKMSKPKWVKVHRLVCEAFYGTAPEGKNITDHKDLCRVNNYYKNLHWVDRRENVRNTREHKHRRQGTRALPIRYFDKDHNFICDFKNAKEASEVLGLSEVQIRANLSGQRVPFKIGYFRFIADIEKENV